MKVEIKNKELIITIPLQAPTPSKTGKTLVVATTHGNIPTTAVLNGRTVTVGLSAYIRNEASGRAIVEA